MFGQREQQLRIGDLERRVVSLESQVKMLQNINGQLHGYIWKLADAAGFQFEQEVTISPHWIPKRKKK